MINFSQIFRKEKNNVVTLVKKITTLYVIKMSDILTDLYGTAVMQDNVYAKALANFIFRQVIEDAHSEYNIPQEEMKKMCKEAVNRAAVFLQILENESLYRAFAIEAIDGIKWDEPEMTEDLEKRMELYKSLSDKLNDK